MTHQGCGSLQIDPSVAHPCLCGAETLHGLCRNACAIFHMDRWWHSPTDPREKHDELLSGNQGSDAISRKTCSFLSLMVTYLESKPKTFAFLISYSKDLRKQNQAVAVKGTSLTWKIPATLHENGDNFQSGILFRIVILYRTTLFSLNN